MELDRIPPSWRPALAAEVEQPYFAELRRFVEEERRTQTVFPPEDEVFSQLELTPYDRVKVLILGQDPYHGPRQAHGLAFSVRPGVRPPPSLANIFKELHDDRGCPIPGHGYLASWAERGVLLLNAVLTVRRREPNSHKNRGWERFTDAIIRAVNERENTVAFVLWGAYAGKKGELIDSSRHAVIRSVHPSPYSADKGFFGSKPFSRVNEALERSGQEPVDWCLPETVEEG